MTYSPQDLEQIEKFASLFLPISKIAAILDVPPQVLRANIKDRNTEVSRVYYRGKLASEVKIAAQEMQLAYVGSPLALENIRRSLEDMEDDE